MMNWNTDRQTDQQADNSGFIRLSIDGVPIYIKNTGNRDNQIKCNKMQLPNSNAADDYEQTIKNDLSYI